MEQDKHYIGQRLSLKAQVCTIRYIGPVAAKLGLWLGVEWDDPFRGKHNGTHAGLSYFKCTYTTLIEPRTYRILRLHVQAEAGPQHVRLSSDQARRGTNRGRFWKR